MKATICVLMSQGMALAAVISTDNFDGLTYPTDTPWGASGTVSTGQWTLTANDGGDNNGRVAIDDNSMGYNPPTPYPSTTGFAFFANGFTGDNWTATLADNAGHYFDVGDKVSIDFSIAGRAASAGSLTLDVSLVGTGAEGTFSYGTSTPTSTTAWDSLTTSELTITTAGTYNVVFESQASAGEGTTFLDSVSYNHTPVPEPAAAALGLLGFLGLLRRRRA